MKIIAPGRCAYIALYSLDQIMPALDGPFSGHEHMEGNKRARSRLPRAQRMIVKILTGISAEDSFISSCSVRPNAVSNSPSNERRSSRTPIIKTLTVL